MILFRLIINNNQKYTLVGHLPNFQADIFHDFHHIYLACFIMPKMKYKMESYFQIKKTQRPIYQINTNLTQGITLIQKTKPR